MAVTLAEALGLWGIMDVEAILHEERLKVLEIDTRFPSQTPMAVYHSTDVNMLEILAGVIAGDPDGVRPTAPPPPKRSSILEHIRVRPGCLSVEGEGMMAGAGPLHLEEGFFGVHEALTNYTPGRGDWAATLMVRGADMEEARAILDQAIHEIRTRYDLGSYLDRTPPDPLEQGE
jgi:pyrrolysine biosynthesis protein PylC